MPLPVRSLKRQFRLFAAALVVVVLLGSTGCQSTHNWFDSLKGEGFPEWSDNLSAGAGSQNSQAKPSGFFTDRRSEQIERSLGGGF